MLEFELKENPLPAGICFVTWLYDVLCFEHTATTRTRCPRGFVARFLGHTLHFSGSVLQTNISNLAKTPGIATERLVTHGGMHANQIARFGVFSFCILSALTSKTFELL